jgi:hypothetical protein
MVKKNSSKPKTQAVAFAKAAKPAKAPSIKAPTKRTEADAGAKKMSALDAAGKVLELAGQAMTCQELIEAMASKGFWNSPGGKTPANTLSAAIRREIHTKGKDARFTLAERGKFGLNGQK